MKLSYALLGTTSAWYLKKGRLELYAIPCLYYYLLLLKVVVIGQTFRSVSIGNC